MRRSLFKLFLYFNQSVSQYLLFTEVIIAVHKYTVNKVISLVYLFWCCISNNKCIHGSIFLTRVQCYNQNHTL